MVLGRYPVVGYLDPSGAMQSMRVQVVVQNPPTTNNSGLRKSLRTKWPLKGFMVHILYCDYSRTWDMAPIVGFMWSCTDREANLNCIFVGEGCCCRLATP